MCFPGDGSLAFKVYEYKFVFMNALRCMSTSLYSYECLKVYEYKFVFMNALRCMSTSLYS